jgi:predicted small lipoprotein YifL
MKKILSPLAVIVLTLMLSACGYDGSFRYPCQDPANWENDECKPPICIVNGACPEDLVGDIANQDSASGDTIDEQVTGEEPSE